MYLFNSFFAVSILIVIHAHENGEDCWSVDHQLVERASQLTKSLLGLPEETLRSVVQRSTELYLPTRASPGECREHSKYAADRVLHGDMWAMTMVDASTKLVSGVLDGRIQDFGNYDQCVRVREPSQMFKGQHCIINPKGILPDQADQYLRSTGMYEVFPASTPGFSLCVPSSCSVDDVRMHLNTTLDAAGVKVSTDDFLIFCSTGDPIPLRPKIWIALGVFFVLVLLVIFSTWYDTHTAGTKSELLTAFSLRLNCRELVSTRGPALDISCLTGLRILCAVHIVFSHRMSSYLYTPLHNRATFLQIRENPLYAVLGGANMSTDVFFLISGLLRTYGFLRHRDEGRPLNIMQEYVMRYFRVMPTLAVAIFFTTTFYIHLSDGPQWRIIIGSSEAICNKMWWTNILHLTNFVNPTYQCRRESWFLATDFQLYVLSPLILIPLYHRPRLGIALTATLITASSITKLTGVFTKNLFPELFFVQGPRSSRVISEDHMSPLTRSSSFAIGILLGYLLYNLKYGKRKLNLTKQLLWLGWSLSVVVMLVTPVLQTYMMGLTEDCPWLSALYICVLDQLRMVAIAWLILACTTGHSVLVNQVLSWPGLYPLARLTFGVYSVHVMVIGAQFFRSRQAYDFNLFNSVYLGFADLVVSFMFAAVVHLTVEAPCLRVVGALLRRSPRQSHKSLTNKGSNHHQGQNSTKQNTTKQNSKKIGTVKEKKRKEH